jgi:hypothetical protein
MAWDTVTAGDILQEIYSPASIAEQQHYISPIWGMMGTAPEVIAGESLRFAVEAMADNSFGFVPEGQAIASPNNDNIQQAILNAKPFLMQVQMSGLLRAISGSQYAFADVLQQTIDRKLRSASVYFEGLIPRDGTGQLALVNEPSAVPNTTGGALNVDNPGTTYLRRGMNVDFLDTSTNVKEASAKIVDVDHANNAITLDTDISTLIGDNSKLFLAGTQTSGTVAAREPNGLADQVKTSGTWNGLALATYPALKGNVLSAGSVDITEDILQRAQHRIEIEMGLSPQNAERWVVFSHTNQRRKYLELVRAQKQFTGLSLDAGYKALEWNGSPWITSNQMDPTTIYMGDMAKFQKFWTPYGPLQMDSEYNGSTIKWLNGFDALVIVFRTYFQFAIRVPKAFIRITGLNEASF